MEITDPLKNGVLGQLIAKRSAFMRSSGVDQATTAAETASTFEAQWKQLELRLKLVPGKEVLKRMRDVARDRYGVTLSDQRILSAFRKSDIPADLLTLLTGLDDFRRQTTSGTAA